MGNRAEGSTAEQKKRIWDLPTRLFHWLLVTCVIVSVVSAKMGGNAMVWHLRCGYAVLALLVFRVLWGLVGGRWSRFASFFPSPAVLTRYLRRQGRSDDHFEVGHNPLGALSVLAMLLVLLLQAGSGLIADDEIDTMGPLVRFVSDKVSHTWTTYHTTVGQYAIYVLVVLHLAAILYLQLRKRRDLIRPMFSGDKAVSSDVPQTRDSWATRLFALLLLGGCAVAVYLMERLGNG